MGSKAVVFSSSERQKWQPELMEIPRFSIIFHHFPTSIAVVGFQRRLEVGRPGQICTCRLAKTELVGFQEGDGIMVKDVFF